jgi:ParB/RepB/Spo0J family partition protein
METPTLIPIELIDPNPWQPRQVEDPTAIAEIAESIKRNGLMQVPTARRVNGHYQLAFGHTRLAAYKLNGEPCMPLIERDLTDLQMFELGVAENVKRRDLNAIEQAEAMKRYMDEFGKSSVEAGEFFNLSDEAVRGQVRLLNLTPEAQKSLAQGSLTVSAARTILSMQKIAPREVIAQTVKQIEQGQNRHGSAATAEEIIDDSIRRLDESVLMWMENRDGKPRSHMGYNEPGWLLSNKSFPNKLLPKKMSAEEIAIALGVQADEEICQQIDAAFAGWGWSGEKDWEELIYPDLRKRLADHPDLLQKFEHLLNPPACTSCPFYTRINGNHFCGMKTCHTRRTAAWHAFILNQAVNNLRIPLYDKKDGKYQVMDYEHEKLFTARNKDLRLIPRDQVRGYHYQHFTGVEDAVFLVVMTGKTLTDKTQAAKEIRAVERQTQSAAERRNELIDEHRKLLEWEATVPVKALFDGFNLAGLHALTEAGFHWEADEDDVPEGAKPGESASEEVKTDFQRRIIALAMLDEAEEWNKRGANCESFALHLCDILVSWGLKPPKGFVKAAQRFDEEIKEAVSAETGNKKNGKR